MSVFYFLYSIQNYGKKELKNIKTPALNQKSSKSALEKKGFQRNAHLFVIESQVVISIFREEIQLRC